MRPLLLLLFLAACETTSPVIVAGCTVGPQQFPQFSEEIALACREAMSASFE